MPNFVIEREIPGAGEWTPDQMREAAQGSLDVMQNLGIQWIHSYVTDDKVYCVYWAPNADLVKEHAKTLDVPANRVSAVRNMMGPHSVE